MSTSTREELLQSHLNRLLQNRAYPKTICPSEVPRALTAGDLDGAGVSNWRDLMSDVRKLVWQMRDRGEIEILQGGEIMEDTTSLEDVRGPIRIRKKL